MDFKYILIIVALCILIGIGIDRYAIGYKCPEVIPTDTTYVQIIAPPETVFVKPDYIVLHDTVLVDSSKGYLTTDLNGITMAHVARAFEGYGKIDISYFFPPRNEFKLIWEPFPKTETIITKIIYVPRTEFAWYQSPWLNRGLGFAGGIMTTVAVMKAVK